MFILRKQFRFEAAHKLPFHDGKCARLHGHSFIGWIEVRGSGLITAGPKTGMLVDYADIGLALHELVDGYLDHRYLNESLNIHSPTSEEIARWIYRKLQGKLPIQLQAVEVFETCTSFCRYEELQPIK